MFSTFAKLFARLLVPELVKLLEAEVAKLEAQLEETKTDGQ